MLAQEGINHGRPGVLRRAIERKGVDAQVWGSVYLDDDGILGAGEGGHEQIHPGQPETRYGSRSGLGHPLDRRIEEGSYVDRIATSADVGRAGQEDDLAIRRHVRSHHPLMLEKFKPGAGHLERESPEMRVAKTKGILRNDQLLNRVHAVADDVCRDARQSADETMINDDRPNIDSLAVGFNQDAAVTPFLAKRLAGVLPCLPKGVLAADDAAVTPFLAKRLAGVLPCLPKGVLAADVDRDTATPARPSGLTTTGQPISSAARSASCGWLLGTRTPLGVATPAIAMICLVKYFLLQMVHATLDVKLGTSRNKEPISTPSFRNSM
jgi:hypothetical protein